MSNPESQQVTLDEPRGLDSRTSPRAALLVVVLLVVVGGLVPVLIAAHYDALEIPRSDDWSYLIILFRWVDHGQLVFNSWAATPLIGQLTVAAPVALVFGRSVVGVHILSASVGVVALVAVVAAGRRIVSLRAAVLVGLTLGVSPLWMPLAPTFMSDHWALAAEMLALACALESFRRRPSSLGWLTASVGFGFLGVAIRHYALVGVAAILVAAFVDARVRLDRRQLRAVLLLAGVFLLATAVLLAWWGQRPGVENLAPRFPNVARFNAAIKTDFGYLRLLGLLLAPVVLLAGPVGIARSAWRSSRIGSCVLGVGIGGALILDYVRAPKIPFVGNYVARSGVLGQDVLRGPRPTVVPDAVFDAMVWIGMLSLVVIALRAVPMLAAAPRWLRSRSWPGPITLVLVLNLVGFAAWATASLLVGLRGFDRYLLPVVPIVAFSVLRWSPHGAPGTTDLRRLVGPVIAASVLGVVGVAFAADAASFDATRWEVARRATQAGYRPLQVDGGFEWVAWHSHKAPPWGTLLDLPAREQERATFEAPFCVRVAVVPGPMPRGVVARATSTAPSRRAETIVAYRLPKRCPGAR